MPSLREETKSATERGSQCIAKKFCDAKRDFPKLELEDVECQGQKAMEEINGRFAEWFSDPTYFDKQHCVAYFWQV